MHQVRRCHVSMSGLRDKITSWLISHTNKPFHREDAYQHIYADIYNPYIIPIPSTIIVPRYTTFSYMFGRTSKFSWLYKQPSQEDVPAVRTADTANISNPKLSWHLNRHYHKQPSFPPSSQPLQFSPFLTQQKHQTRFNNHGPSDARNENAPTHAGTLQSSK